MLCRNEGYDPRLSAASGAVAATGRRTGLGLVMALEAIADRHAGCATRDQLIRIAELRPIGAGTKLAVVEFGGKQVLVAISRTGVTSLAIDDRGEFDAP